LVEVIGQPSGIYELPVGMIQQGELVSGLVQQLLNVDRLREGGLEVDEVTHSFVVIVSQSCDLEWDRAARQPGGELDKVLPNVMVCEAHAAMDVKDRKNVKGEVINNSKIWPRIRDNKDERFHFFEEVPGSEDAAGEGIPELVVDFKRYFSMPTDELYLKLELVAKRRSRLKSPYLEHFSSRFFQFQCRVATPRQHLSK